ncbi:MAG TPA: DUF5985 family protein [Caulobacteraceae bacterium]|jgi:hypothetical protein|nr:DUF5985 family protein [Caulobacteraceae bacterium]
MSGLPLQLFFGGVTAGGFLIAGGFFLRFWSKSRDPLFLAFALAFWLMAIDQGLVQVIVNPEENRPEAYLPRLAAFALIALAILRKNLTRAP